MARRKFCVVEDVLNDLPVVETNADVNEESFDDFLTNYNPEEEYKDSDYFLFD